MIVAVALAVAFACGVDVRRLGVLAGAVYLPWAAAALVVCVVWRARPDDDNKASLFCEGVSAELRAGAALRDALADAATSVGAEPLSSRYSHELPLAEVAATLGEEFPAIADELGVTVLSAATSGSQAADLFDEIGSLAIAQSEIRREVRVATAPGRATAMVLVGTPTVYLMTQASSGGLRGMLETSPQRIAVVIGLGLFFAGATAASMVVWRANR